MDRTLVLVKPEDDYLNRIFEIIKEHGKKACYVTFNKTPDFILESAEKNKIPRDRFYFLDGITARIKGPVKIKNSTQIGYFDDLARISKSITNVVNEGYSLVIFDSLSDILIYPSINDNLLVKLLKQLFEYLDNMNGEAVFVCYKNDIGNYSLDKTISLFNNFVNSPFELFGT